MNGRTIALLLTLATSTAFASGPNAASCLSAPDAKECLASIAVAALAADKSPESRVDGMASLLFSLAKTGVRRDNLFSTANNEETAPIYSRWFLAVARRTYAMRYDIESATLDSPQRIEALAELLRRHRDGLDRLLIIVNACEAREGEPPDAVAKWAGTLDRLCRIAATDSDAMEKGLPGLSAFAATLVDSYNRDEPALRRSIAASLDVLSGYEKALNRKIPPTRREAVQFILAIGNLFNATALAISGHGEEAGKAIGISLENLAQAPTLGNAPELQIALTQASWIYAKAGMRKEALSALRKSLARIDRRSVSGGDRATAIGVAIETLRILESVR